MKNYNNRGKYTEPIDLPYIQIPRHLLEMVYSTPNGLSLQDKMIALWLFTYAYWQNKDLDSIMPNVRTDAPMAFMFAQLLYERISATMNNARWAAYDKGYGQDLTTDEVIEVKRKEAKEKKKQRNKKNYQKNKLKLEKQHTTSEIEKMLHDAINNE